MGFCAQYLTIKYELCIARPTLNYLNSNKLHYYQFVASLDRCSGGYLPFIK